MSEDMSMSMPIVDTLRTFSPQHRQWVGGVLDEILRYYGENLLGLAIFGSFARGENRKGSDLDLLIILKNAGKRRIRIEEFIREIEMKHDDLAQQLFRCCSGSPERSGTPAPSASSTYRRITTAQQLRTLPRMLEH